MPVDRTNPLYVEWLNWRRQISADLTITRGKASELARALGVSRQTISRWFHGHTDIPAWADRPIRIWLKQHPIPQSHLPPSTNVRLGSDKGPTSPEPPALAIARTLGHDPDTGQGSPSLVRC